MPRKRKKRAPVQLEKKTLPQLRKKLWSVLSPGLRAKWRKKDGSTNCYTCSTPIPKGGKVDCGHGYPKKKYKGTYYDERNLRPQCVSCNLGGQGEQWIFFHRLITDIGQEEFNEMSSHKDEPWCKDKQWYIKEIRRWQGDQAGPKMAHRNWSGCS